MVDGLSNVVTLGVGQIVQAGLECELLGRLELAAQTQGGVRPRLEAGGLGRYHQHLAAGVLVVQVQAQFRQGLPVETDIGHMLRAVVQRLVGVTVLGVGVGVVGARGQGVAEGIAAL
ncbi:hypothetical protein D9M68_604930 [compost metagenome]